MTLQFADPGVSHEKFDREIEEFRALRSTYEARGWFLIEACFPLAFVVLATPKLRPPAVVCGVAFDYSNYDASPPSVRLADPFTREPYLAKDLPTTLNKALPSQALAIPGMAAQLQMQGAQPLMQAHHPEEVPFLCIAGVREYHDHPGHSGDLWELHRTSGAGRLVRILEVIAQYGVDPIRGYGVNLVPQVFLETGEPPA